MAPSDDSSSSSEPNPDQRLALAIADGVGKVVSSNMEKITSHMDASLATFSSALSNSINSLKDVIAQSSNTPGVPNPPAAPPPAPPNEQVPPAPPVVPPFPFTAPGANPFVPPLAAGANPFVPPQLQILLLCPDGRGLRRRVAPGRSLISGLLE
ncbi:hypothetical protein EYR38_000206 [Pleurotus pulmonarius]|nr:hypothetical protein EYR38_000206 [Pleurotus pulmonarius]